MQSDLQRNAEELASLLMQAVPEKHPFAARSHKPNTFHAEAGGAG